jgi:hypothetical protein
MRRPNATGGHLKSYERMPSQRHRWTTCSVCHNVLAEQVLLVLVLPGGLTVGRSRTVPCGAAGASDDPRPSGGR